MVFQLYSQQLKELWNLKYFMATGLVSKISTDSYELCFWPCFHLTMSSKAKWVSRKSSNVIITSKPTLGSDIISDNWNPFKSFEKCFLFHVKRIFRL